MACTLSGHAAAPTRDQLQQIQSRAESQRKAAEAAAGAARTAEAEEGQLAERRVAAARRAQEAETALSESLERLDQADARRAEAEKLAQAKADALKPMLPLMRRLSLWPAETLLAVPASPEDSLRGTLVMRQLARKMAAEAASMRDAQAQADVARTAVMAERVRLVGLRQQAVEATAAVEAELAVARERRATSQGAEQRAARQAQATAAQAGDLKEMLDRLDRARERAEADARRRAEAEARQRALAEARDQRRRPREEMEVASAAPIAPRAAAPEPEAALAPSPATRGGRTVPVSGRVTRDWGSDTATGPARGVTYAAAGGARVVAPCAGRAAFAGPFRSYGLLLIVDCGGGYHFVLAGLDRLDAATGQRLLAGEPVGVLGDGSGRATLYVELRRNGQPIDPKGWYAGRS